MLESIKSKLQTQDERTHLLGERSLDQVKDEGDFDKYKLVYWVKFNRKEIKKREIVCLLQRVYRFTLYMVLPCYYHGMVSEGNKDMSIG